MEAEQYDTLARIEDQHWFFAGQWRLARSLIRSHLPADRPLAILDAGCGTGGTSTWLRELGSVVGVDAAASALAYARRRGLPLCRASIEALPFADGSFDLVTSFDVLYHRRVTDDVRALGELRRVLKPGGLAFVRTPALPWLGGAHDVRVHTRQRYRRGELGARLRAAGLAPLRVSYANTLLLPLVLAKRALDRVLPASSDLTVPPAPVNRLLASVLALEALAIQRMTLPLGVSLVALARRP